MSAFPLSIAEYGDGAVMVSVRGPHETERRRLIREFRDQVLADVPPGVEDIVSGLETLLVEFDALRTSAEQVAFALGALGRAERDPNATAPAPRRFSVPIIVTPETAPDLADVAAELGIAPDEVIGCLERSELTVSLLAAAMAPMMEGLDVPAPVRRQATPRTDVPAGSVMIAGRNVIIQPFPGPTGWRVIGRTTLRIVDIERDDPVSYRPGDIFTFHRSATAPSAEGGAAFLEAAG